MIFNVEVTLINKVTCEVVVYKYKSFALSMGDLLERIYVDDAVHELVLARGFIMNDVEVHRNDDQN